MVKEFTIGRYVGRINKFILFTCLCALTFTNAIAQGRQAYTLTLTISDSTGELPMATCHIREVDMYATSDMNGIAQFKNLPGGTYKVEVSYVGFENQTKTILIDKDTSVKVTLQEASLALKEVTVLGKVNENGLTSSTLIERQAIDHLQATSLADVMQLVPGHLMSVDRNLTSKSYLSLRTVTDGISSTNTVNNNFGSAILIDGISVANNTSMNITGEYSTTESLGTDMRQISSDDIESIEVVQGIPSVEYGDLTSGMIKVNTKKGVTPYSARVKVNSAATNVSVSKGLSLGDNKGTMNLNFDYAESANDPRDKAQTFDRYTASATYTNTFLKKWYTTTSLRYSGVFDWQGNDPDLEDDGTYRKDRASFIMLNHNGRINVNKLFSRTVKYALSGSINQTSYRQTGYVNNSTGFLPIVDATETGYHQVPYETISYLATGGSKSNARKFYAKVSNTFFLESGKTNNHFNMGAEYTWESNNGRGYYNEDPQYPYKTTLSYRPRAYSDIPAMNQIAVYLEDNFTWDITNNISWRAQLGGRFQALQPGKSESVSSFSPRFNTALTISNWGTIRGGYGISEKTPGMIHLYPATVYNDRLAAKYTATNKDESMVMYHTYVYQPKVSEGLKNMKNNKAEIGADISLPGNRRFSITLYEDVLKNAFSNGNNIFTYTANYYDENNGLNIVSGQQTTIDMNNPARTDTVFLSTGEIKNNGRQRSKGAEFNFNFGQIPIIRTSLTLSGAYMDTKSYSRGTITSSPTSLPASYTQNSTVPFKLIYPSIRNGINESQRFSTSLQAVCHIPELRLIVSLSTQVIWYERNYSYTPGADPIAWIDTDESVHAITQEMLDDENYTIKGISLADQRKSDSNSTPTHAKKSWFTNLRLTKELGKAAGLSFYANNITYYEPYKKNDVSGTISQRTNGYSFGAELYFKF